MGTMARQDLVAPGHSRAILTAFSLASAPPCRRKVIQPGGVTAASASPNQHRASPCQPGVDWLVSLCLDGIDGAAVAMADIHAWTAVQIEIAFAVGVPE